MKMKDRMSAVFTMLNIRMERARDQLKVSRAMPMYIYCEQAKSVKDS